MSALITNTVGRALDITGDLGLSSGPGGLSAGPYTVQKATTVAPGNTQNVTFTLPRELPNGSWTAAINLKSGLLERQASSLITFPDADPGETRTHAQDGTTQWIPWAAAGTALLALITTALLLQSNKRRRNAVTEDSEQHGSPGRQADP